MLPTDYIPDLKVSDVALRAFLALQHCCASRWVISIIIILQVTGLIKARMGLTKRCAVLLARTALQRGHSAATTCSRMSGASKYGKWSLLLT